jgi:hypothetical protein
LNYITLTSLGELKGGILLDCRLNFGASGAWKWLLYLFGIPH